MPLHRITLCAGDISGLVVAVMRRIDMKAIYSPTDTGVVCCRPIATVDMYWTEPFTQWLKELLA
jgi:hypothetical protein